MHKNNPNAMLQAMTKYQGRLKPNYNDKVRKIRPIARKNPDGSNSTVLLSTMIVDGKYYAVPTLFPKLGKSSTKPEDWMELKGIDAFKEAKKRNELFEFTNQKDAESFAKGNWKN